MNLLQFKILVWILGININASAPVKTDEKKCIECHATIVGKKVVHPVAETCESCHSSNGKEHPLAGVKGFALTEQIPQLCNGCHDAKNTKKNIHAPVETGECQTCHSPHSTDEVSLLIASPPSKICEACHDLKIPAENKIHSPVKLGSCQKCHDPHQSDNAKFLKSAVPNLCFTCHGKEAAQSKLANIHPPFEAECATCHSHHSSKENNLLSQKVPALCYTCHSSIQDSIAKAAFTHKPVKDAKSCSNCHSPHASAEKKFLTKSETKLCLNCHNKAVVSGSKKTVNLKQLIAKSKTIHAPIESDGCKACHNPHSSGNAMFLKGNFPAEKYVVANSTTYGLCFGCHDIGLFENKTTTSATNFRDGEKNLHYLHLNGTKGRSCTNCHNVHASANDHLIEDKVTFGKWEMPINFKLLEKGGSCAPGCHSEKSYISGVASANFNLNIEKKTVSILDTVADKSKYKISTQVELKKKDSATITRINPKDTVANMDKYRISDNGKSNVAETKKVNVRDTVSDKNKYKISDDGKTKVTVAETKKISAGDTVSTKVAEQKKNLEISTPVKKNIINTVSAEDMKKSIAYIGYVYSEDLTKHPVAGADVILKNAVNNVNMQLAKTDENGNFIFLLDPGRKYRIEASKPGAQAGKCNTAFNEVSTEGMSLAQSIRDTLTIYCIGDVVKLDKIYYDADKADILPDAAIELNKLLALLKKYPYMEIELRSHTDCIGPADYNMDLSVIRAFSCVEYLLFKGIASNRVKAKGCGETLPANKCTDGVNCTESELRENRRTEFEIIDVK